MVSPGGFNLNALTTNKAKSHDHIFTQVVTRAPTNAHTKKNKHMDVAIWVRMPNRRTLKNKLIYALTV